MLNQSDSPATKLASPADNPENISNLLSFWFDDTEDLAKWFKPSPLVDTQCKIWTPLVIAAREGRLSSWYSTPLGVLAILILLDQLPRNIYRGSPKAFESDDKALSVALDAIASGFDRQVALNRQMFFYLPIMHTENLLAQIGCLGLYQGMLARAEPGTDLQILLEGALGMAQVHVDIIKRFGRFPGRNEALGRITTPEEEEFLETEGPMGSTKSKS